jgi:hypothetical protein
LALPADQPEAAAPVPPSNPPLQPSAPAARTKSTRREDTLPPSEMPRITAPTRETPVFHIDLNGAGRVGRRWEWLTWIGLIGLAAGSALAAYYLIPDGLFRR